MRIGACCCWNRQKAKLRNRPTGIGPSMTDNDYFSTELQPTQKFTSGFELLNRDELSVTQDRQLQRYIDENKHLLQAKPALTKDQITGNSNIYNRPETLPKCRVTKRKEVKFLDETEPYRGRARSLTPTRARNLSDMSHYGSVGSLYNRGASENRDYLYSPAYSMLNRSQDDSLRFETGSQCSRQGRIRRDSEGKSKFSGYGDRPGSGVEFSPFEWKGGEVLYDPKQMPRSLKPRRLYYSPIGDGVVAADGVEMKRRPKDMSPRITISHIRTSEPGEPGRPGYNLYEKHIVHGGESAPNYDVSAATTTTVNPRSTPNLSSGNDLLERLSKQPVPERATPDSAKGRSTVTPSWPDTDYYQRNTSSQWSGAKNSQERSIPIKYSHDYNRFGSAPPTSYNSMDKNTPTNNRYNNTQNHKEPRYNGTEHYADNNQNTDRFPTALDSHANDYFETKNRNGNPVDRNNHSYYSSMNNSSTNDNNDNYSGDNNGSDRYVSQTEDTYITKHHVSERYTTEQVDERYGNGAFNSNRHDTLRDDFDLNGTLNSNSFGRKRCVSESSGNFDVKKDYLITNPRELIHHYATTTPVAVLDPNTDNQTNLCNVKKHYVYETEERYAPYPPYKGSSTTMHPNNFVRQLRDENLTSTQREANRCREPLNVKDEQTTRRLTQICQQTRREVSPQEIDYITEKLLCDLRTGHPTPSPL